MPIPTNRRRAPNRRGFATIVSLFALMLVVSALAAGAALLAAEQRRTHAVEVRAELRQLLAAGAADVMQRIGQWNSDVQPQELRIELPSELGDEGATLLVHIEPLADGTLSAGILAARGADRMRQNLVFHRSVGAWTLARIDAQIR